MPNFHFYLNQQRQPDKPTSIYFHVNIKQQVVRYAIGLSIAPKHWDKTAERAIRTKAYPQHVEVNTALEHMLNEANKAYALAVKKYGYKPTAANFKEFADAIFRPASHSFFDVCREFAQREGKAPKTIARTDDLISLLTEFERTTGTPVTLESIDARLYNSLLKHMKEKEYKINTARAYIVAFKAVIRYAQKQGKQVNDAYRFFEIPKPAAADDSEYLTEAEIEKIHNTPTYSESEQKAKDIFSICCYTGLRYSDAVRITPQMVKPDFIEITTKKTKAVVRVPKMWHTEEILQRYNNKMPHLKLSYLNQYIRRLAERAGFTELVTKTITTLAGTKQVTKPRCEFLASHTGRRSFATNAFKKGVPTLVISKITGHKTESSFLRYIGVKDEEVINMFFEYYNK